MRFSWTEIIFFYFALSLIYLLNWQFQFYGWDPSWGVHEARRMLAGGTFGIDFSEPTPPLFLYLYSIPVLVSKAFGIPHIMPVFQLFIITMASLSLFTCYFLVKQLARENKVMVGALLLTIAAIFLLLPLPFDFGQREHMLVILIMPYCLLMALRLQDREVRRSLLIMTGILAAMGFALKPFFLITFGFIELYGICYKRNFSAWVRLESLIIIGVMLIYALVICMFYQEYFYQLQLNMRFYYQSIAFPWSMMIFMPVTIFSYLAITLYLILYQSSQYKVLGSILVIAIIAFLIAYFLQQTIWYYHALPAYSFAVLLAVLMGVELIGQKELSVRSYVLLSILGLLSIVFGYYKFRIISTSLVLDPVCFFSFFAVLFLFAFCITQKQKNYYKALGWVLLVIAVAAYITFLAAHIMYLPNRFLLTTLLLLLLFGFVMREGCRRWIIFTTTLMMLLLAFPFYNISFRNWMAVDYKAEVNVLSDFIGKYARHQSVQFFTTTMCFEFPAIDYAEALPASRYAFFVWMPALLKLGLLSNPQQAYSPLVGDRNYLLDSIGDDLNKRKPALVFVDIKTDKPNMRGLKFEYLPLFLQNQIFQQAWKSYQYFTTIERLPYYKYAVYKRRDA